MYYCARCGEDSIESIIKPEYIDEHTRAEGWCDVCNDIRPASECADEDDSVEDDR